VEKSLEIVLFDGSEEPSDSESLAEANKSLPANYVEKSLEIVLFDGSEEPADSATLAEADNNSAGKS